MRSQQPFETCPKIAFLVVALALLWLSGAIAQDQPRTAPQTIEPGASCVSEECHSDRLEGPFVHGPLQDEPACDLCHEADGDRHAFSLAEKGDELCYACHESVTEKRYVHAPLEEDESCVLCHDPHASKVEHLLRAEGTSALCLQCHDDVGRPGVYHLSDVLEGCTTCHDPHSSDAPRFLHAAGADLCYTCHDDIKEDMAGAAVVHGPVTVGCVICHDPHDVRQGKGLEEVDALCARCHEHFGATLASMAERHPMLLEDAACVRCHQPHMSSEAALLRGRSRKLCLACHDSDIKSRDGGVISSIKAQLGQGAHLHGPLAEGDCTGCHSPHANERFRFLLDAYPSDFYSPYSDEAYALCLLCHDASLAAERRTTGATNFRDGDLNLHYVHVNRARKGRTCRACHAPHASENPFFLREAVPFGAWEIPLGFTRDSEGGTCASGCHRVKSYVRADGGTSAGSDASQPAEEPHSDEGDADADH